MILALLFAGLGCFHVSVQQIEDYAAKIPAGDAVIEYIDRDGCTLKLLHQTPRTLPKDHLQFPQPPPIDGAVGWRIWQLNPQYWPKRR